MKRRQVDAIRARTETEPLPLMVPHIESDKGTVRKVTQYGEYYSVITSGIEGVKGWQPKLLFYDRCARLDKAFAESDFKTFAITVSYTIGGMK